MNTAPAWLRRDGDDVVISVHVQPGAARSAIVGEHGGALKMRLGAPPVDGKANAELTAYIARLLGLPRARVEILSGLSSRQKRVRVALADADAVFAALSRPDA
ncbi:MAG: YggU family protein [Thermomicrobiales bacterium]|nr:MAG: YggU family protein [Thermomicrobiales bacterium]